MRWLKSRINNIPTTNCVQLGIENYIWIWWYNYSILMLFMPITGSNLSYEKHMRMKVEREGPTLKLTPLNTCLSPNDLWTSLHSMSTSWSSSIWPFKSLLLDKVELYSTCPRKTIHQDKLHSMAIQLNAKKKYPQNCKCTPHADCQYCPNQDFSQPKQDQDLSAIFSMACRLSCRRKKWNELPLHHNFTELQHRCHEN